jgi:hypothetical protein
MGKTSRSSLIRASKRGRSYLSASLAAVLAAATISAVNAGDASAAPQTVVTTSDIAQAWSSVPEFSSAPALARGQVIQASGVPASAATVLLFPVPLPHKVHTNVPQAPLARTSTDSSGHFVIRLPAASDHMLTTARSNGALNLQVMAFYPGGVAVRFYTVPSAMRAAASQPTATLTLRQVPKTLAAVSPAGSAGPATPCGSIDDGEIAQIPVVMGFKQSADTHLRYATFMYTTSDSLTIGVGISATSPVGGFTADGTLTQSSGGSTQFPQMVGAGTNSLLGDGVYDEQFLICPNEWVLIPKTVDSDFGTPGASPVSIGNCLVTQPNTTLTYTQGTQQTFSGGVNLSAKGLGANLSVQDGWSNNAALTYSFGSSSAPVCGQANFPSFPGFVGVIGIHS